MKESLLNKIIEVAEGLEWTVMADEDSVEFYKFSPAGEDFGFGVGSKDIISEVRGYANGFDTEEHVKMWLDARVRGTGGVPDLKTLVQDADDIQEMLDDLAEALEEINEEEYE